MDAVMSLDYLSAIIDLRERTDYTKYIEPLLHLLKKDTSIYVLTSRIHGNINPDNRLATKVFEEINKDNVDAKLLAYAFLVGFYNNAILNGDSEILKNLGFDTETYVNFQAAKPENESQPIIDSIGSLVESAIGEEDLLIAVAKDAITLSESLNRQYSHLRITTDTDEGIMKVSLAGDKILDFSAKADLTKYEKLNDELMRANPDMSALAYVRNQIQTLVQGLYILEVAHRVNKNDRITMYFTEERLRNYNTAMLGQNFSMYIQTLMSETLGEVSVKPYDQGLSFQGWRAKGENGVVIDFFPIRNGSHNRLDELMYFNSNEYGIPIDGESCHDGVPQYVVSITMPQAQNKSEIVAVATTLFDKIQVASKEYNSKLRATIFNQGVHILSLT